MSLKRRALSIFKKLSMPVSYKLLDQEGLYDARNVFDNKGVTETRNGIKRYNSTSLGARVLSISYFKKSDGTRYKIVKIGSVLYSVAATGAHTAIKTGLSADTKHRGVTLNDRHIIAVESDGIFSFNGTTFTQLGQDIPSTVTAAASAGGSLTANSQYQAAITYYASTIGFESNAKSSTIVTVSGGNLRVALTNIPATAANALIDKVRIYLKDVTANGEFLYIAEVALGTTTYNIDSESSSTQTPPEANGSPLIGGGKFLTVFGKSIAYAGNDTFKNDVFISEEYVPDAYDDTETSRTLEIPGQGDITGIACGLYDNSHLRPFLAIFKKTSTTIYSELDGSGVQTTIDEHVGCVSHDTIRVRNGAIYFMSENGWYQIVNGSLVKKDGIPYSLGGGAIDDIFSRDGWTYQLNAAQYSNFFSVYYSTLGHYLTFVSEGSSDSFTKAYNYEERIGGFRVYDFKKAITCACEGEDDSGNQCIFLGDQTGSLFTLSVKNERHDEDEAAESVTIPAFIYLPFIMPGDDSSSYNFRMLTVKALNSDNSVTVRAFPRYSLFQVQATDFDFSSLDFSNEEVGFVLDMSQLDVGVLADERIPTVYQSDLNRTGETLMIGFYQDTLDANMGLISAQISYNKNGNRNL